MTDNVDIVTVTISTKRVTIYVNYNLTLLSESHKLTNRHYILENIGTCERANNRHVMVMTRFHSDE